ncbi:MAG: protein phosphatase 2C family protein [Microcystis aeruginosa K13-05]|jgi:serine/threonine protein phosphatase PrpC|uniref:Protein phosphatase 2C family protein n=1 Tax=Microcystis flos-aquae Mf_QC_C_20070823_S10D TaxID=2486236 RepID=A0A552KX24_9CHRO|nr:MULTISPECIES: PP2C family serine/threonine-protein phosphatase [unclassified Microcystis]MCA2816610.1 protein phosphatase 2C family protein [Microcystis sp. M085S1]MCA2855887.1 protein phosphatase 2C family protein [Microcystis sp. M065S1]NCR79834.1 protein phosphatase 2C family protein [Microcystis aeruginosa K13-10]NCR84446.1 protein phosphatase 2C family protein [Microcystis aeruginosa K13-05]TRU02354.1 MAG: protein phosphatase 2C family protein [Microcystis flos-aquae Ma_QC_C_20070823_S
MESHHKVSVIRRFSDRTHKEMETISGCQDNFSYNEAKNCFAIADGATQSFYSSIWSKLLVDYFCENPQIDKNNWQEWLELIQQKWLEEVRAELEKAKSGNNFAWIEIYNGLERSKSATSTFIGLQFIENQAKISIVGDSCLFIFQGNQLIQTYLLKKSTNFNDRPGYFGSRSKNNDDYEPEFLDIELKYKQHSDKLYFVLATDALAEYIFKYTEQQRDILTTLLTINSEQEFENFVKSARHNGTIKMKNDDVTLMILEVSDREIVSLPTQTRKENQKNTPIISPLSYETEQPSKEDQNNSLSVEKEPKDNTPAENLEDTSGFAKISSNLQTLLKFLPSLPMTHRNLRGVSSSSPQLREDKPPVIKGIDGIRNLLLVFIPLNIFLTILSTATILYFISQTANKINSIKTEQSSNSNSSSQVTKYEPKYMNLEKGNKIYKDQTFQEIIIPALSDSSQVLILEEGDKWIKFQIDLYANQAILNQCSTCARDEIEIKPKTNLRTLASESERDVFGQLSEPSKFKKLEFDSLPNWSKFTFVGYVKK